METKTIDKTGYYVSLMRLYAYSGVMCRVIGEGDINFKLREIKYDAEKKVTWAYFEDDPFKYSLADNCYLILRPLSDLTMAEKNHINGILGTFDCMPLIQGIEKKTGTFHVEPHKIAFLFMFLIRHRFDVMGLIGDNLAFDATKLQIQYT
jgi:hypothetical protein